MRIFRRRPKYTDTDAKLVGFFFAQYVELMKHGKDTTDDTMKRYVSDVILDLGVPDEIVIEEEPIALPEPEPRTLIIHRNKNNGS